MPSLSVLQYPALRSWLAPLVVPRGPAGCTSSRASALDHRSSGRRESSRVATVLAQLPLDTLPVRRWVARGLEVAAVKRYQGSRLWARDAAGECRAALERYACCICVVVEAELAWANSSVTVDLWEFTLKSKAFSSRTYWGDMDRGICLSPTERSRPDLVGTGRHGSEAGVSLIFRVRLYELLRAATVSSTVEQTTVYMPSAVAPSMLAGLLSTKTVLSGAVGEGVEHRPQRPWVGFQSLDFSRQHD